MFWILCFVFLTLVSANNTCTTQATDTCIQKHQFYCEDTGSCIGNYSECASSCALAKCPSSTSNCSAITSCSECTMGGCYWCEASESCVKAGYGATCPDLGYCSFYITENSKCCNQHKNCTNCVQPNNDGSCKWDVIEERCISSYYRNGHVCVITSAVSATNASQYVDFVCPNSLIECSSSSDLFSCLQKGCIWDAATSQCMVGSVKAYCTANNTLLPLSWTNCVYAATQRLPSSNDIFPFYCNLASKDDCLSHDGCVWCEDNGGSCQVSPYLNSKSGHCVECLTWEISISSLLPCSKVTSLLVVMVLAVVAVHASFYILFKTKQYDRFWYQRQVTYFVGFFMSVGHGLAVFQWSSAAVAFSFLTIDSLILVLYCSLLLLFNAGAIIMRRWKSLKVLVTDDSLRLTTIVTGGAVLVNVILDAQTGHIVSDLVSPCANPAISIVPIVVAFALDCLSSAIQSYKCLSQGLITTGRPKILLASYILGQLLAVICYVMGLVKATYCFQVTIDHSYYFGFIQLPRRLCDVMFPGFLVVFGMQQAYANNEITVALQSFKLKHVGASMCGVSAVGPLLFCVCIALIVVPLVIFESTVTATEKAILVAFGLIGIVRSLLLQLGVSASSNSFSSAVAASPIEDPRHQTTLQLLQQQLLGEWKNNNWKQRKDVALAVWTRISGFLGTWKGIQYMILFNAVITTVSSLAFFLRNEIPPNTTSLVYALISVSSFGVIVAGHSLFVNWKPRFKLLPMDESLRLSCMIKAALIVIKGLILAASSNNATGGGEAFDITLSVLYILSLVIAVFITLVDVRTLWFGTASKDFVGMLPHQPRVFLVGYGLMFSGAKAVAILLPLTSILGDSINCTTSESTTCLSAAQKQVTYSLIGLAVFFALYINNEIARYLEYWKLSISKSSPSLGLSDSYAGVQTYLPFCFAAFNITSALSIVFYFVSETVLVSSGQGLSQVPSLPLISCGLIAYLVVGVVVLSFGMMKFRKDVRGEIILIEMK